MSNASLLTRKDLEALVESGRELSSQVERADLLQHILATAGELTDSPDTSVILHNERRKSLYFAGATGDKAGFLLQTMGLASPEQVRMESIAGEVFRSGESQIIHDVSQDARHDKVVDGTTKKSTQNMVCVPLKAAGKILGVMQLLNKRAGRYTEHDRELLEHFADQAAVAIRNARLVEDLVAHMGLCASPEEKRGVWDLVEELNRPVHEEELTIMFADMRGFVRLCQELRNPGQIQRYLSEFLNMIADEVISHGGVPNKFLGDGVLAFFRRKDYALRSVTSALRIADRFTGMRTEWDKESNIPLTFLDVGIGLATDTVLIGPIVGTHRSDFTVIGEAVNVAARFEQQARGGKKILCDHRTYSLTTELVEEDPNPETVELKKPDQPHGQSYKQYHLRPKKITRPAGAQVFLSHNSKDKPAVRQVAEALKSRGINVWFDEWNLIPGRPWQDALEDVIKSATSASVLVGKDGLGPWEIPEMRSCLSEFIKRGMAVIPVLLPGAPSQIDLPLFLQQFTWVDLREGLTNEGLNRLQWGVTGQRPRN